MYQVSVFHIYPETDLSTHGDSIVYKIQNKNILAVVSPKISVWEFQYKQNNLNWSCYTIPP